jgi:hypothetical protein
MPKAQQCLWYLVARTLFAKDCIELPRGLEMLLPFIVKLTLFVYLSENFK